jgi:hypothetical protein
VPPNPPVPLGYNVDAYFATDYPPNSRTDYLTATSPIESPTSLPPFSPATPATSSTSIADFPKTSADPVPNIDLANHPVAPDCCPSIDRVPSDPSDPLPDPSQSLTDPPSNLQVANCYAQSSFNLPTDFFELFMAPPDSTNDASLTQFMITL